MIRNDEDKLYAAHLQSVLDSPTVNIFSLDKNYCYTSFNTLHAETIRKIWGIDVAIGMNMLEQVVLNEHDRAKAKRNFDRALSGEELILTEAYGHEPGSRRFFEDRYGPTRLPDGTIIGISVFVTDVTERIQYTEERLILEKKLQETAHLESLGLLASSVAHDFNNLLVPVMLCAELAILGIGQGHPVTPKLQVIIDAAQRAADLTKQLLAFSGRGGIAMENVELNKVISESLDLARVSLGRKTELKVRLCEYSLPIIADPTQIRQVLTNLLINAAEAATQQPSIVTLETSSLTVDERFRADAIFPEHFPDGEYAILSVSDNGCGLDDTQIKRIFEPFYSTKGTGRGFGLAAIQGIVRKHSGILAINSRLNRGSQFQLGIPLLTSNLTLSKPDEIRDAIQSASNQEHRDSLRILLADDDFRVRDSITSLCQAVGHQVTAVEDGEKALQLLNSDQRFDLMILDLTMPRISGLEVVERIPPELPTPILVTSGFSNEAISMSKYPRVFDFLCKPFSAADLFRLLKRFPRIPQ